jgi:hypothetical protein
MESYPVQTQPVFDTFSEQGLGKSTSQGNQLASLKSTVEKLQFKLKHVNMEKSQVVEKF